MVLRDFFLSPLNDYLEWADEHDANWVEDNKYVRALRNLRVVLLGDDSVVADRWYKQNNGSAKYGSTESKDFVKFLVKKDGHEDSSYQDYASGDVFAKLVVRIKNTV